MELLKKFACSIISIIFFALTASAQRDLGIATSEWSAMNSLYLNPASIAGCHEKVTVTLFSVNLGVDNNLGTFTKLSNLGKINNNNKNDSGSNNSNSGINSIFTNSGRQKFSMLLPSFELRGPGALVRINDRNTIAVTTRVRLINQFNNFDQSLYQQITNGGNPPNDYSANMQKFNWTAHLWSEIAISYGYVVWDDDRGLFKVGATLRRLGGIGYLGVKANDLNIKYFAGKDSFYATKTDLEYASNIASANSSVFNGINTSTLFGNLFGSSAGGGFGGDLGATYMRVVDFGISGGGVNGGDGHKLTASAAVTDIGAINYKQNNYTINVSGTGYLTGNGLKNLGKSYDSARAYFLQQGFNADTGNQATKVHMPTTLVVGADYQVYKHFYANITYLANLANRQLYGNSIYNQVTITPRYDAHVFTIGLPITYSMLADDLKVGLGVRVGGFFFGSDDMLALVSSHQYGFNVYLGGYVPICRKLHKDRNSTTGSVPDNSDTIDK